MYGICVWGEKFAKRGLEGCSVALFVNTNPNGGFFTDSGRWPEIAQRGRHVADTCLVYQGIGGGGASAGKEAPHCDANDNLSRLGALGKLTIIVFAPGSDFDRALNFGVERCELFAFNTSTSVANRSAEAMLANSKPLARGHRCRLSNLSLD